MASSETGRPGDVIQDDPPGSKVRLEAIRGMPEASSDPSMRATREEAEPTEGDRRGLPIWLFLVVFVVFSLALVWQVLEARRLEGAVATLEQDLTEARTLLGAHRDHLGEIRAGVEAVSERLGELRRLVEAGPETIQDADDRRASVGSGSEPGPEISPGSVSIPARLPES